MKNILVGIFFSLIGLSILAGDFFITSNTIFFLNNSVKAEGQVVEIIQSRSSDNKAIYSPRVVFIDSVGNEITFTSSLSTNISSYSTGDKVEVFYEKSNPQNARINSFFQIWFATILMSVLGVAFFLGGFSNLVKQVRRSSSRKNLLSGGTKIIAKVTSVQTNLLGQMMPIKTNVVYPTISGLSSTSNLPGNIITYTIVAQWLNPQDSKMYVFTSEPLKYNPESLVLNREIGVYIEPGNPSVYLVDISNLPQSGN